MEVDSLPRIVDGDIVISTAGVMTINPGPRIKVVLDKVQAGALICSNYCNGSRNRPVVEIVTYALEGREDG